MESAYHLKQVEVIYLFIYLYFVFGARNNYIFFRRHFMCVGIFNRFRFPRGKTQLLKILIIPSYIYIYSYRILEQFT